jgi:hypothetical protein
MEPDDSLPYSQQPATGLYPKPDESNWSRNVFDNGAVLLGSVFWTYPSLSCFFFGWIQSTLFRTTILWSILILSSNLRHP